MSRKDANGNGINGGERHDGFSAERKRLFLTALRCGECVLDACALVGVSNRTAYNHRDRDPVFARDWVCAVRMFRAPLELAAYRRGVEGIEAPIYRHGKQIGTRRLYSDALLKMLLAGEKPRKYGRRAGLNADRKWLTKTIAAVIAPYKAELDAALAELRGAEGQGRRTGAAANRELCEPPAAPPEGCHGALSQRDECGSIRRLDRTSGGPEIRELSRPE